MNPEKGWYVKIYFKNGYLEEGVVELWDKEIILVNDDALTIIKDADSIFIYKIIFKESKSEDQKDISRDDTVYVDKEMTPTEYIRDPVDRAKNLYELRKECREEEQERARKKLTEFEPSHPTGTTYDNFSILRDESVLRNTSKKD